MGGRKSGFALGFWVFLLLVAAFGVVLNVPMIWASGTIYVRADGSVDPETAPIFTTDNVTYIFADNIFDSIVVERNNIVIDGAGYTIQGPGPILSSSVGIRLTGRSNVTVKNFQMKAFDVGVRLEQSSNITIHKSIIAQTYIAAVYLTDSSNNTISENQVSANDWDGILLYYASNSNIINGNNVTDNHIGIRLIGGSSNNLFGNRIIANDEGLELYKSGNNVLRENVIADSKLNFGIGINLGESCSVQTFINDVDLSNTVNGKPILYIVNKDNMNISSLTHSQIGYLAIVNSTNITVKDLKMEDYNLQGILLAYSTNSSVENTTLANNHQGLTSHHSSNNRVFGNNVTANSWYGMVFYQSNNNNISKNIVRANGHFGIKVDCSWNNILWKNSVTTHSDRGIWLSAAHDNRVIGNIVTATNGYGISLDGCSGNSLFGNNVSNNKVGVGMDWAKNNRLYHNSFVGNTVQARKEDAKDFFDNMWDAGYPFGGNYWSDYNGTDVFRGVYQNETGSDGIGDISYVIDTSNQDKYPLMNPCGEVPEDLIPPITLNDYGGLWHTIDFTITLAATDDVSDIAVTYYKINNEPTKTVSTNGQPLVTTEGASNKLEYWTIDNAGNEELPHKILTGIKLDKTSPNIGIPTRTPDGDVLPNQPVNVSLNITDATSQVKNVTLSYRIDDSGTWTDLPMNHTVLDLYETTIPPKEAGTIVRFKIVAYDYAGNSATFNETEPYCIYQVIPELSPNLILLIFMTAVLIAVIVYRRKCMISN